MCQKEKDCECKDMDWLKEQPPTVLISVSLLAGFLLAMIVKK
jgi:hypothetical protein